MWSLLSLLACRPVAPVAPAPLVVEEVVAPRWPEVGALLRPPVIEVPAGFTPREVFIVAGHGAPGNAGNLGSTCVREQDFTLRAADRLARMLDATGQFVARRARSGAARPSYAARLARIEASAAVAVIELHSDARGWATAPTGVTGAGEVCWKAEHEPGFTVLVRDRGPDALVAARLGLARQIARALAGAGFAPWAGDYGDAYEADEVPGVWRDRRRLFMLDRPSVPSVIIETHNAWDLQEARRWEEGRTHDVFGRSVVAALIGWLGEQG